MTMSLMHIQAVLNYITPINMHPNALYCKCIVHIVAISHLHMHLHTHKAHTHTQITYSVVPKACMLLCGGVAPTGRTWSTLSCALLLSYSTYTIQPELCEIVCAIVIVLWYIWYSRCPFCWVSSSSEFDYISANYDT